MSSVVFYHATIAESVASIVGRGLAPSSEGGGWADELVAWSQGKAFVTSSFNNALFYGRQIWTRQHPNCFKVILRLHANADDFTRDAESADDFYSLSPIIAAFEVFVPCEEVDLTEDEPRLVLDSGRWEPLSADLACSIADGEWDGEIIEGEEEQ